MSFDGALIKEQGVTFAIVVVKPHVLTIRRSQRYCTLPGKYSPIQNTLETLYSSLM